MCILDVSFDILDCKIDICADNLVLGWVFSDWDIVIGILDCDYVILDDYLLFEGENLLFLIVYLFF